jgi:hypothetical protein
MDSLHKDIGRLMEGMEWVKSNIAELRAEVNDISQTRWKLAGMATLLGGISSILMTIVFKLFSD